MKALIRKDISFYDYNKTFSDKEDFLNKVAGKWLDCSSDYYHSNGVTVIVGDKHIFLYESDIVRTVDDFRNEIYSCGYCRFQGSKEEVEQHFKDEEKLSHKTCSKCFYAGNRYEYLPDKEEVIETNGRKVVKTTKTCITYKNCKCTYNNCDYNEHPSINIDSPEFKNCPCEHDAHRRFGSRKVGGLHANNPTGFLYEDFKYKKFMKDENIVIPNFCKSYTLIFNPKTLDFNCFNSRNNYDGKIKWFDNRKNTFAYYYIGHEGILEQLSKALNNTVDDIKKSLEFYNKVVTTDEYYTNPDGSNADLLIVDGKTLVRPKPIKLFD